MQTEVIGKELYRGENMTDSSGRCFTFKDREIIEKLIKAGKLTERQKTALEHLYKTYNYLINR